MKKDTNNSFAGYLKQKRKTLGLTQKEMAIHLNQKTNPHRFVGLDLFIPIYITRWENGLKPLKSTQLLIVNCLGK